MKMVQKQDTMVALPTSASPVTRLAADTNQLSAGTNVLTLTILTHMAPLRSR
jgi:1-aminocyclopropane-1-carboxylate deaminase/D-cysteine desulfhydrase-like pyridoxal-dependent ACC family enzyme